MESAIDTKLKHLATISKTRTSTGVSWKIDTVKPEDLHDLLGTPHAMEGKIALVDCQHAQNKVPLQFMGAIHLRIMGPQQADSVIKGIHKQDPAAFEDSKIMKADLVVFYCSLAQARSPAAADAYKKLRQELSKNKPLLKPAQKIVVLEGGIAAYSEVNGSKTKLTEWGKFPSKDIWEFKQVVPLKGDAEGNVKPNDTKRQTKMASTPGGDHDEHPEPNLSMGQSKRAPQPTGGRR